MSRYALFASILRVEAIEQTRVPHPPLPLLLLLPLLMLLLLLLLLLLTLFSSPLFRAAYLDSSEDLVAAYQAYAARQSGNDLCTLLSLMLSLSVVSDGVRAVAILEFMVKWESTYKMLLNELIQQNTNVQEAVSTWMKTGLEPARVRHYSTLIYLFINL